MAGAVPRLAAETQRARGLTVMQPDLQGRGGLGPELVDYISAIARVLDATSAAVSSIGAKYKVKIHVPALEGFGAQLSWAGRVGFVNGLGDLLNLLADLARVFDQICATVDELRIPQFKKTLSKLPMPPSGSWAATFASARVSAPWPHFLPPFADSIDEVNQMLDDTFPPATR